jgi:sulfate permease, SulP family
VTVPLIRDLRAADPRSAARDVTAGVELAAMNIPQSLGYASIAGMPAVTGFYTLLLPLVGFSTFGSSTYLVVAADSATAAILAGGLSPMASPGTPHYVALAALTALLTAGFLLIARVLKLGFLADFLSQTTLAGFLAGVGIQVGIAVLGQMLGLKIESHRTVLQLIEIARDIGLVHLPSMAISTLVVAGVLILSRYAKRIPAPLIAVLGSIAASAAWNFAGHGIAVIGPVAGGLPRLALPGIHWKEVEALIPIAASCFAMIVTQSAATARIYALRHHQKLDENEDLIGLSAANALAAISGTFVVNGSPTQTAMVESFGAKSRLAQISTAGVVALVLLFLTYPLQFLPRCVLGSIVFIVAVHLIDLQSLRAIRRESPGEFALALTTAAVVVLIGVEQGIILAMVMSLLRIVHHSYHPHTAVLVRGEGDMWQLIPAVPGAITEPGLVIYRFDAPLFYANAGRFAEEIRGLADGAAKLRWVLVDAAPITRIDYSAARLVQELHAELASRGIELVFAHVRPELQDDLRRHRIAELLQPGGAFDKLHEAIAYYRRSMPGTGH